jgi:hypothetical protein
MTVFTVKPLDDRTGFKGHPKRSPFDSSWSSTLQLLGRELRHLRATNVIVEVDTLPGSIRLDGQLYANAKVHSPAIRLHFDSDRGHLSYETDAFTTWQDNVRAVALALEALRRVDRYQIGRGGEQYRGYLALEAGTGATALGGMTREQAYATLVDRAGIDCGPGEGARLYKLARANAHPDRNDDARTAWDQVEQAAKVLGLSS